MKTSRLLYVFAPARDDIRLLTQLQELTKHQAEADDRQLVVIIETVDHSTSRETRSVPPAPKEGDQSAVRRRFGVAASGFMVILVGKDGGEKLRSSIPIPFGTLRETIDSMPMRQREMRK